ncbi:glycosyltransferase family 2 protein [Aliarcobacter butzleri]|uniref:glycosyltransferase family 2 protein n=1 Tax=Aliarcobacter butzleri TaxID=28197 RepID=UPI0021B2787A|nr:glycosyltransferase family 2 protein [Aliarcobacter butzleri]MCT7593189.1 glycosyltransferase family 2 protein [Aliarcobacter butzleri]MCT7633066.1 glycosyltransferase family 2 protein [Aliarcobacter butzleri]
MKDKIILFIPMYNCEKQIIRVIDKLSKYKYIDKIEEVLFIDNISQDNTVNIVRNNKNKILIKSTLIQNNKNYGLGGSHKVAFNYAIKNNYNYLIVLHGDDQGDINCLSEALISKTYENYDCYLGGRFHSDSKLLGYSKFRTLGNKVFNFLFSIVVGERVYDLGSGLNMYKTSFLNEKKINNFANNLTFNVYLLLYSIYKKQRITFFSLTWSELDQISNAKVISQGFITLGILRDYFSDPEKLFEQDNANIKEYNYKEIK